MSQYEANKYCFYTGTSHFPIYWILINVSQSKKNSFSEATPHNINKKSTHQFIICYAYVVEKE